MTAALPRIDWALYWALYWARLRCLFSGHQWVRVASWTMICSRCGQTYFLPKITME